MMGVCRDPTHPPPPKPRCDHPPPPVRYVPHIPYPTPYQTRTPPLMFLVPYRKGGGLRYKKMFKRLQEQMFPFKLRPINVSEAKRMFHVKHEEQK